MADNNSRFAFNSCIICGSRKLHYAFTLKGHRVVRCDDCGFMLINPQPSDIMLDKIDDGNYLAFSSENNDPYNIERLKKIVADKYLDVLIGDADIDSKNLLEIGYGNGYFLGHTAERGIKVTGVDYSTYSRITSDKDKNHGENRVAQGGLNLFSGNNERFDYIIFCDVLERVPDPQSFLQLVFNLLKPNGKILCVVPSLDSWPARLLKTSWMEFRIENLFYFDEKNLRSFLFQNGFSEFKHFPVTKILSLENIARHLSKNPVPFLSSLVKCVNFIMPRELGRKPFSITASSICMVAEKRSFLNERHPLLSVIMPAYNEINTIQNGIDKVLQK